MLVDVRNATLRYSDPHKLAWPRRALTMLEQLRGHINQLPNSTFLAWFHDGCSPSEYNTNTSRHFVIAAAAPCQDAAVPMPYIPVTHNPFWENQHAIEPWQLAQKLQLQYPWEAREPVCFWRGSGRSDRSYGTNVSALNVSYMWQRTTNRGRRGKAALLSKMFPTLLDAKLTDSMTTVSGLASFDVVGTKHKTPFPAYFLRKYALDMDGVGSSFRLPSLFLGGSVVLMPDTYKYWWSDALLPYKTWIPLKHDLSDLLGKLQLLKDNDAWARTFVDATNRALQRGTFSQRHQREAWRNVLQKFPSYPFSEVRPYLI